jgi:hypothetical protein
VRVGALLGFVIEPRGITPQYIDMVGVPEAADNVREVVRLQQHKLGGNGH